MDAITTKVGVGLAWAGAAAVVVGAVLVLGGPDVAANVTRIASGGWFPIAGAIGVAGTAAWVARGHPQAWPLPVGLCVITSLPIVVTAADPDFSTGYPWGSPQATALLVTAVGIAVALIGSLLLSRGAAGNSPPVDGGTGAESGACPRCARAIPPDERACGYCGFAVHRYRSGSRG
ncbi:hypothetical protein CIW49_09580 [Mycolicibacterium sp. P1-18]|uniref:zinc ribbon domain-containing protein n=1 Tax=Mycolicibacterium sp. P1-18 TaxID=2024615 RepID=UPI0011F0A888|nr:zinc ribbon domain-containing protein [Mycolicibacterium sp. P1-18]KAA0099805.1 hypothetical protein CIW49_09580 [Mycolicibacterium sp. P1-18]